MLIIPSKKLIIFLLLNFQLGTAQGYLLNVTSNHSYFKIEAILKTESNLCSVWKTLTDYENLPSFTPNLIKSKVVKDMGNKKVIHQVIKKDFFLFPLTFQNTFMVEESLNDLLISVRLIKGDLKIYHASWELKKIDTYTQIRINAKIMPTRIIMFMTSNNSIRSEFNNLIISLEKKLKNPTGNSFCWDQ